MRSVRLLQCSLVKITPERVNDNAKEKLEVDAFCKVAKSTTEVTSKQDVFNLFDVLQGAAGLDTIKQG